MKCKGIKIQKRKLENTSHVFELASCFNGMYMWVIIIIIKRKRRKSAPYLAFFGERGLKFVSEDNLEEKKRTLKL